MRRPLIGGKDFQTSIEQREQAQGWVMGGLPKEEWYLMCFFLGKKEEKQCVKGKLVLVCERMLFMEKMCANKKHGKKLCVVSSCSGIHGRISMNKHLDTYIK
jgi:hypothetical protein